jgi:hypothetical protein
VARLGGRAGEHIDEVRSRMGRAKAAVREAKDAISCRAKWDALRRADAYVAEAAGAARSAHHASGNFDDDYDPSLATLLDTEVTLSDTNQALNEERRSFKKRCTRSW